jgi:hypothetical protein
VNVNETEENYILLTTNLCLPLGHHGLGALHYASLYHQEIVNDFGYLNNWSKFSSMIASLGLAAMPYSLGLCSIFHFPATFPSPRPLSQCLTSICPYLGIAPIS